MILHVARNDTAEMRYYVIYISQLSKVNSLIYYLMSYNYNSNILN